MRDHLDFARRGAATSPAPSSFVLIQSDTTWRVREPPQPPRDLGAPVGGAKLFAFLFGADSLSLWPRRVRALVVLVFAGAAAD